MHAMVLMAPGTQLRLQEREDPPVWAGASDERPEEPFDGAINCAPIAGLVPTALSAVRKGGRVVCAGVHMSDIPSFPCLHLWGEKVARQAGIRAETTAFPLYEANEVLAELRAGGLLGAAVRRP